MSEIERIIKEVDSSMSMEGMPLTSEDKNRIKVCLKSNEDFNKTLLALLEKHTVA